MTMNAWTSSKDSTMHNSPSYIIQFTHHIISSPVNIIITTNYVFHQHLHYQVFTSTQSTSYNLTKSSSYHQDNITKRFIIMIIINDYHFKESITIHNHILHKRRTINHIILNTKPSLIHSYFTLLL